MEKETAMQEIPNYENLNKMFRYNLQPKLDKDIL
jgi:hypothetical protein